jgi:two-component system, chemotaxis family, CheB/CheR fusion protein
VLFTPEDRAVGKFQQELRRACEDGRAEDDRWHVRRNGSRVYCSGITSPLVDEEMRGYVKIARDLTGSKWAREQQDARLEWERQERIRAEEAAHLRDEFFAVLSHELKQPLNLIQLTAEMLSRLPETAALPAIGRGTATIKRMVEGQARIIDDLMDLSRLHTGKLTLTRTRVNFNEAVSHVVGLMASDAQKKGVALTVETVPHELIVVGDMVRIEQIVWNLLSNALKFTPAGGSIHIRLSEEGDIARLEVEDTGRGIPSKFLPFVFDMFRQADSGTTRQFGGMGIGLALVKELVSSHGGWVEADSRGEGQGARFSVFFPLTILQHGPPTSVEDGSRTLAGKRILLVDDAAETLEALNRLLDAEGAIVTAASSGKQALEAAEGSFEPFHLIVSDIGMPDMDGYALFAELRKHRATASTPAIALSGFTRPCDVDRTLGAGYETHVRKPVAIDQFLAMAGRISG